MEPVVTGITVTPVSASQLNLTWSDPTGLVTYTSINVYRSINGGAYQLVATLAPGTTSYSDVNASVGNTYSYEVGLGNSVGTSVTPGTTAQGPVAPTTISITVTTPAGAINLP